MHAERNDAARFRLAKQDKKSQFKVPGLVGKIQKNPNNGFQGVKAETKTKIRMSNVFINSNMMSAEKMRA